MGCLVRGHNSGIAVRRRPLRQRRRVVFRGGTRDVESARGDGEGGGAEQRGAARGGAAFRQHDDALGRGMVWVVLLLLLCAL